MASHNIAGCQKQSVKHESGIFVPTQSSPLDREIYEKEVVVPRPPHWHTGPGFGNMQGDGHVLVDFGRLAA